MRGVLLLVAAGSIAACAPNAQPPSAPAPVVLITVDTLRADHLSPYGARVATPAAARLASDGVLFEDATAPYPLTLPSHLSLLTGLEPYAHGVRDNRGFRLDPAIPTLAQVLAAEGYATAAFVSSFVVGGQSGADRGFQLYDTDFSSELDNTPEPLERRAGVTVSAAIDWLGRAASPFLLWVHLYDPHDGYQPPEPFVTRYPDSPYAGEVAYADAQIDRLLTALDALGLYERSLIVYTSDHGEGLGDHGEETHGYFVYQAMVRVPLLVKLPLERDGGRRIAAPVGLADVAPTILAALGLDGLPAAQGGDLLAGNGARDVYSESYYAFLNFGWSALASLRRGDLKYIHAPRPELYDLAVDPGESTNLADSRAEEAAAMSRALRRIVARYPWRETDRDLVSAAEQDKLRALGYLSGSTADRPSGLFSGRDPKDGLPLFKAVNDRDISMGRDPAGAVTELERLLEEEPGSARLWTVLGRNQILLGRFDAARASFERAASLNPASPDPPLFLAMCLTELGQAGAAEQVLRRLIERQPQNYRARLTLGTVLASRGDSAAAAEQFQRALDLNPAGAHARLGLEAIQ